MYIAFVNYWATKDLLDLLVGGCWLVGVHLKQRARRELEQPHKCGMNTPRKNALLDSSIFFFGSLRFLSQIGTYALDTFWQHIGQLVLHIQ